MRTFTVGTRNVVDRELWLQRQLAAIPEGSSILDAGAGEQAYRRFCSHLHYVAQDFAGYDGTGNDAGYQTGGWRQSDLDVVGDIAALPMRTGSFDAVLCVEVLEHVPDALQALSEIARVLRPGGDLVLTAPFCSMTHFAPFHFYAGFNRYFYETHLPALGLEIVEIEANGGYFEYLAQEVRRIPEMGERYGNRRLGRLQKVPLAALLWILQRLDRADRTSSDVLTYGFHVHARKRA